MDFPKIQTVCLVVDDDASMRALLDIYLRSFGYRVLLAEDGEDALRVARANLDIRIVVMDIVMSGLSGRQLVDEVNAILPGVGFLFCSGHPAHALKGYGLDLVAGRFLQKPCRPEALKRELEELAALA